MKRLIPILIILLFPGYHASGQLKTYITPEAGPAWDINQAGDPGHFFTHSYIYGTIGGVAIWQEVLANLSIGSGIYYRNFNTGMNPDDKRPHQPGIRNYSALLFPVRLAYRIQPPELKVSFTPRLGYQYGWSTYGPVTHTSSSTLTNEAGTTIEYNMQQEALSVQMQMVEVGLSVDYRLPNNWQFSFNLSHFSGLNDALHTTIDYQSSEGNTHQATYLNNGSRLETTFGINIPVSNLWENKGLRTQRQIESGKIRNASVRRLRYLYVGGDIGALWKSFSTSNPAVGPRPIDGKGLFRYANLSAGGYIGYMFSNGVGFDIGAYYQRSKNYVTLMYDHESDFANRTSAPLFLELPVMFRYRHDIYDGQVFLVASAGGSVYIHFTGENYASEGDFSYNTLTGPENGTVTFTADRPSRIGYAAKAGLGVEYEVPVKIHMLATLNLSYSHGFKAIDITEVSTSVSELPAVSSITYNGSGWLASVGVRFPMLLGKENRRCGALPQRR